MADTYGNGSGAAGQSTDQNAPIYDAVRRRIQQQGQQNLQTNQDQVARQYAAMGTMNSGDYVKQSQQAADQTQGQTQSSLDQLSLAENQEQERRKEFYTGLYEPQQFQAGEAAKQRASTEGMFNQDLGFRQSAQKAAVGFQQQAANLSEKEYQANLRTNYINSIIGLSNANVDPNKLNFINTALDRLGISPSGYAGGGGGSYNSAPQDPYLQTYNDAINALQASLV